MQDSIRPSDEQAQISRALALLAIATRDQSIDAAVTRVYMPHLDPYTVEEVEGACQALQADAQWFPKVAELLKACRLERRRRQDAADAERLRIARERGLQDPSTRPVSDARHKELMAKVLQAARSGSHRLTAVK